MKRIIRILSILLSAVYLLSAHSAFAQKQGNMWLFGEHCGLDFKNGSPAFVAGDSTASTATKVQQGCSSICDSAGHLLFYTNGQTIWNRNDTIMNNGDNLLGNISSTQSSLIVPQPGCSNYYYVFTTGSYQSLTNGFRYSLVDICNDNSLGEVLEGQKNILLLDTVAEKLCAVMDNAGNYWVLVHKLYSNAFYAYHLTSGGLSDPVITRIGSYEGDSALSNTANEATGQMKFSPDGSKVALIIGNKFPSDVELYNFNLSTGVLTNYLSAPVTTATGIGYGVEFSPNGNLLYASTGDTLMQFNLLSGIGNKDSVIASETLISRSAGNVTWGLQLGPDNKIYVCQDDTTLGVIDSPNVEGSLCNFEAHKISLNNNLDKLTLPDFVSGYRYGNQIPDCNYLSVDHIITNACADASGSVQEQVSGGTEPATITWNTDPPQTSATAQNLAPGTYIASINGADPCTGPVTVFDTVTINRNTAVLVLPNAFTPGSNDINSVFKPYIECSGDLHYELRIYNRWGQLLFETSDPSQGWDGKFNGKPEAVDVYDYYVEFACGNCTEMKKGNITLLR